jgi:hypothetical protein
MLPEFTPNFLAIIVCVVAGMFVGFLWFGPVFGKPWARHMGMADMEQQSGGDMAKSMIIFAIGNLLIAWVLFHGIEVWRASNWGAGADAANSTLALNAAIWTWLGFFLPLQAGRVAWEKKGWGLVAINAGFDLVRLLMFAFILAYWR